MARVYPFNNGVLMLRNISAPFLNALEDNPRWTLRGCCPENCLPFTGGRNGFCHFHSFHVHEKNRAFLNLLAKKSAPELNTTACVYIYIYADGCLIEPHLSTLCARNLRKRSAKMIFLIKKWPNFGCHFWGSIKHP